MINLVIQNKKLSDEEIKKLSIQEILKKNSDLNQEDFEFNSKEITNIGLVKMLEENFEEKKKILK